MSACGTKQTNSIAALMSANDPLRTSEAITTNRALQSVHRAVARPGSANEERRGADQGAVLDLAHEEIRDIRTANSAESPSEQSGRGSYQLRGCLSGGLAAQWSSRVLRT